MLMTKIKTRVITKFLLKGNTPFKCMSKDEMKEF